MSAESSLSTSSRRPPRAKRGSRCASSRELAEPRPFSRRAGEASTPQPHNAELRGGARRLHYAASFDHLVGAGEERRRDGQAEPAGGFDVYGEDEHRRLLYRQLGGAGAFEDT